MEWNKTLMLRPRNVLVSSGALAAILVATPAFAVEPAHLTASLGEGISSIAPALYPNNVATSVIRWPGSWAYNTTLKAGTPCSTTSLAAGMATTQVIYAQGNYRKCA